MTQKFKLAVLIGTRPGIVKMAPVFHAGKERGHEVILIHSGQHYSEAMDSDIRTDVGLPNPQFLFLRPNGCVKHGQQTAFMLTKIEEALDDCRPDLFFVCGDANTNLAGALACRKLGIPLAHVEAGLRSNDWRMPEEHNRRMIDHISDILFAPTYKCKQNLLKESVLGQIEIVGNTVADSVLRYAEDAANEREEVLVTLHREENVDDPKMLRFLLRSVGEILEHSGKHGIFLVHPRTKKRIIESKVINNFSNLLDFQSAVPYRKMLGMIKRAPFCLTDSGGVQEEACILGTPCYTLRHSTERPETVDCGSNVILGITEPVNVFKRSYPPKSEWASPFGDGRASEKIILKAESWLYD